MPIELKVPSVGESITEVIIGDWLKKEGDRVSREETLVSIETDKVTVELPAPTDGVLTQIRVPKGTSASVGDVIGLMEEGAAAATASTGASPVQVARVEPSAAPPPKPTAPSAPAYVMPAAQRALHDAGLSAENVPATGPGGRLLKEDVLRSAEGAPVAARSTDGARHEEAIPMSPIRRRIAERLVEAQNTAALLTTFNEVDMSAAMALRKEYQERFQTKYSIKLGFMSFFVKAAIDALKLVPQVNAMIRGDAVVYRDYYDVGVAVGGGKGLVVPVIRNTERLSFAQVEQAIADFGARARDNKLSLEELQGGTFTISNGGVYGSLLSTPIINPPQSGILGLHAIQDRPVARDGQVVIRPMMYVALTYDHRIIDGREAVTFLKRIKECVEEPARMLIEV